VTDNREALRAWLDLLGVSTAIKKGVDGRLKHQFGLSLARFDVMAALDRAGQAGLNGRALSARLKVTEGNTTQVTAPLVEAGLIRRRVSPEDGRVAIFHLTRKGERVFAQMAEANRRWIADAFAALSPAQLAQLRVLLGALEPPQDEEEAA